MANWLLTPEYVRALVQEYLAPPGFVVRTCPDIRTMGVMGVILIDNAPLSPRIEFHLDHHDLIVSGNEMLERLRSRIQKQIDEINPPPAEWPLARDMTYVDELSGG